MTVFYALLFEGAFPFIGPGIPGVPVEYIPNQGAIQALALEQRMMTVAVAAAGILFVLGALLAMKSQWDAPQPWFAQIKLVVIVAIMLSCYPFIFATPMVMSRAAANALFDGRNLADLNRDIREAAQAEMAERATDNPQEAWYQRLSQLSGAANILTGGVVLELILAVTTVIFYASVGGMTFLWKVFAVTLFVTGPLLIVMGLLGSFGERILSAWVTALVQVSLWQVWFAICAFFVRSADGFFYKGVTEGSRSSSYPNHYESVAMCAVFTVAHIATPFIINYLIPISTFSAGVARGLDRGFSRVTGTGTRIINLGGSFSRGKSK